MNKNLHKAKKVKNDEFYTQLIDIEKELTHYKEQLIDKIIYCNCDGERSNFIKYFKDNFKELGIKKLLTNSCDFRSSESIELLKECDIVITNPPFSLFREYISQLIEYNKKFLIIGNMNAINYKEVFKLIKPNKLWLGVNSPKKFIQPDKTIKEFGNILWFTNLEHKKRNEELILFRSYYGNESEYPKYENYDAINVDKTKDIPMDYPGDIGVPITFIDKYNPDQFEIIALGIVGSIDFTYNLKMELLDKSGMPTGKYTMNAKGTLYRKYNAKTDKSPSFKNAETGELYSSIYARVIIRNKKL